ncbi:hypothetical protein Acr_00g0087060 [Actinidia rufa]|uniref:RNI-like superfamily protein n=1 Tax=Actinidia rufa TaxID=165716 RepID=A0A7J0DW48_9ERIC|nr:hypothetical protein Acr_00g0087060 [Actinidia rufa]
MRLILGGVQTKLLTRLSLLCPNCKYLFLSLAMTVLRAREIVPVVKSQSPFKNLKMETIEPTTPAKTLEPSSLDSYATPVSLASAQSTSPLGSGSDLVSERRRSLRLASSRSVDEVNPSVSVSNRKRKGVVSEKMVKCEINANGTVSNWKRKIVVAKDSVVKCGTDCVRVGEISPSVTLYSRKRKGVVAESSMKREGECVGVDEIQVVLGPGDKKVRVSNGIAVKKGRNEAVSLADEMTLEGGLSEIGSGSDLGRFREISGRLVSDKKVGVEKGKLGNGVDLESLKLVSGDSRDRGFLNLRSGKKICKSRMERSSDVGLVALESGSGAKSVRVTGGGVLNVEFGEGYMLSKSRTYPGGDGIGILKDRIDVVETVELGLGCKVDVSFGELLEKDLTIDENGAGIKSPRRLNREEKGKGKVAHLLMEIVLLRLEGKLSREEKGKAKMVEDGLLLNGIAAVDLDTRPGVADSTRNAVCNTLFFRDDVSVQDERQVIETNTRANATRVRDHRERFRDIARQNASRFAHFPSQEVEENQVNDEAQREMPGREAGGEVEDWPGPFSTAMKIIKDRAMNVNVLQQNSNLGKSKPASVTWVPRKDQDLDCSKLSIPSLQDLSLVVLAKNADAITSLDTVPDILRDKLSQLLSDTRRMNSHFLDLLVQGSPTEIRIRDCSWLTEEQFMNSFEGCETSNLMVLQLDLCGCCMPDYVLRATLACSSNSLPALTTISLKGSYRLSDVGLSSLVASAPALRSVNLSQCSLLTSDGISTLADSLGSVLRELYIDDCQNIDALLILPALLKLEHLEVLSLAGIESVCDDFLGKFIAVRGHHIKDLVLTNCMKLTDAALKVIAENCSRLCALDLGNLRRLTDSAMGYLANGCRAMQTLKLCRNLFSDEAIAAYLEASGESLTELSLNNVSKVGHNTAITLARRSIKLFSLDLSWCRNLTDEAVGLIVDSCLSLKLLKLFGCTQIGLFSVKWMPVGETGHVTDFMFAQARIDMLFMSAIWNRTLCITNVFLDGHSNPQVQIIGLKTTPLLEHLKVPDPLGALHYSSVSS